MENRIHNLTPHEFAKAIGVGGTTGIALSAIMVPATLFGISPMPEPLGLAFAETITGSSLPLLVGLLFHLAWVTFVSVVFIDIFRDRLTFTNALVFGLGLWVLVLVFFFPFVGWGFFGIDRGPMLIVGALIPHLLFSLFLWGLSHVAFDKKVVTHRQTTI